MLNILTISSLVEILLSFTLPMMQTERTYEEHPFYTALPLRP